jgi:hypothetical protein
MVDLAALESLLVAPLAREILGVVMARLDWALIEHASFELGDIHQ